MVFIKRIVLFLFLLIIPFVYSEELDCQYKVIEEYTELGDVLVYENTNKIIGKALNISDFYSKKNISSFMIHNPNPFDVMAVISYEVEGLNDKNKEYGKRISAFGDLRFTELCLNEGVLVECQIIESSVNYFIKATPDIYVPKKLNVKKERLVCKKCKDITCFDDGDSCLVDWQCGGGYCVEKICSNTSQCYLGDCNCPITHVQCPDDSSCVEKNTKEIGETPICRDEECVSNFVDSDGKCVYTDEQKKNQEMVHQEKMQQVLSEKYQSLTILIFIIIMGIVIFFYLKGKDVQKKIENLREKDKLLEIKRQELKELDEKSKEYQEKEQELTKLIGWLEEAEKDIIKHTQPHPSKIRAFWEWYNPNIKNKYYPCYVDKDLNGEYTIKRDKEIHKDLAKKEIFNQNLLWFKKYYPGKNFEDLLVHHVDKNIFNYDLQNLIIISRKEHDNICHGNITHKDWKSGIKELIRLGIKAPHILELDSKKNFKKNPYKKFHKSRKYRKIAYGKRRRK